MKNTGLIFLFSMICLLAPAQEYADLVDMYMGVKGKSNCVLGPQLPHGSVNPSPQTRNGGHGGYKEGEPVRGFAQLHVSGTGWSRYGQVLLSPQMGFEPAEDAHDSEISQEISRPYYYEVKLDRYHIKTQLAPTHHGAIYRFSYPEGGDKSLLLDMAHSIPQHVVPEINGHFYGGEIRYNPTSGLLVGWGSYNGGFGSLKPYHVYFSIQADVPLEATEVTDKQQNALYARIPVTKNEVNLKIAVSMKSIQQACRFLHDELENVSLEEVKLLAKNAWDNMLGKITVSTDSPDEKRLFYTTFYHSLVMPRDRSGDNPSWESDQPYFDDHFCIWDTWRTKYPLMTLLDESFVSRSIQSFIDRFEHNGMCNPSFTSGLEFEDRQGGDDVENVIADAMVKGVKGFDYEKAYNYLKWNAFHKRSPEYQKLGWQPDFGGLMSVSNAMEYAYNDYCTAQAAQLMKDTETYTTLLERSTSWEKLFNPSLQSGEFSGFVGPRKADGTFISFDPDKIYGSWVEYFYEGNAWTYTMFVPHQFDRLIELSGGAKPMIKKLKFGFDSRLITLFNEPGFLSPFLFHHMNRPDLTSYYVNLIRTQDFSLEKGYLDNEDSGAMGSWYIFTSLGLFPNAGQDYYYLTTPAFKDITLQLSSGGKLHIQVKGTPTHKPKSILLNGKKLDKAILRHQDIRNGAEILFVF